MAKTKTWVPGDVVRLKSGGPPMTVCPAGVYSTFGDEVWCMWFEQYTQRLGAFYSSCLEEYEPTPRVSKKAG